MDATFSVDADPSVSEAVEITAKARIGSAALEWTGTVAVNPGDAKAKVSLVSVQPLPDEVGCFKAVDIAWQFRPKGRPSASAGTSRNILYVTLGNPSGTPNHRTLLDISCKGAAGARDEAAVVEGCFRPFTRTLGDRKGFKRKRDGKDLTYYMQVAGTAGSGVYACCDLLSRGDGTARCGAWGDFLVAMHKVHGITSSRVIGVVPEAAQLFIVRNCAFPGAGSGVVPFTHKGRTECVKQDGIPGQGKDNPHFIFGVHAWCATPPASTIPPMEWVPCGISRPGRMPALAESEKCRRIWWTLLSGAMTISSPEFAARDSSSTWSRRGKTLTASPRNAGSGPRPLFSAIPTMRFCDRSAPPRPISKRAIPFSSSGKSPPGFPSGWKCEFHESSPLGRSRHRSPAGILHEPKEDIHGIRNRRTPCLGTAIGSRRLVHLTADGSGPPRTIDCRHDREFRRDA